MQSQATPPDNLQGFLDSPDNQRVDVIAIVVHITEERSAMTGEGPRKIVDATIRDLSGPIGAPECQFPTCFKDTDAGRRLHVGKLGCER